MSEITGGVRIDYKIIRQHYGEETEQLIVQVKHNRCASCSSKWEQ